MAEPRTPATVETVAFTQGYLDEEGHDPNEIEGQVREILANTDALEDVKHGEIADAFSCGAGYAAEGYMLEDATQEWLTILATGEEGRFAGGAGPRSEQ